MKGHVCNSAGELALFEQARLGADEALPLPLILNQHQTPVSIWLT